MYSIGLTGDWRLHKKNLQFEDLETETIQIKAVIFLKS